MHDEAAPTSSPDGTASGMHDEQHDVICPTRTTTSYRVHDEQERELNDAAGGAQGDRRWGARGAASPWDASPQPVGAVRGDHKGEDAERGRTAAPAEPRAPIVHTRRAN